jgi:hypothetical protein
MFRIFSDDLAIDISAELTINVLEIIALPFQKMFSIFSAKNVEK